MKSKILFVSAALFAFSLSACSSESKKYENTQVPEMSTTMPAEISTVSPEAEPEVVKQKRSTPKKKTTKKKAPEGDSL
jgi:uncharacterized lipoprotein YbaY